MNILGLNTGINRIHENIYNSNNFSLYHDTSASIISNGKLIAAFEEERLNRIKHTNKIPVMSIKHSLERADMRISDIDLISICGTEKVHKEVFQKEFYSHVHDQKDQTNIKEVLIEAVRESLNMELDRKKIVFVNHHLAHASSAYYLSGYDNALVVTIDGAGDGLSGLVIDASGNKMQVLDQISIDNSVGDFYLEVIQFLGYTIFDEYKVMGLAPYGNPNKYGRIFRKFYTLLPEGKFALHLGYIVSVLKEILTPRKKGEAFTAVHMDIAAALQESLETIVIHILKYYKNKTGHRNLCLAGGVAHNCSMNGKILYSNLFESLFIQPASHDAGCSIGAALYSYYHETSTPYPLTRMENVYLGTSIGERDDVYAELQKWRQCVAFSTQADIVEMAADLLAEGKVIGWVQGNAELGPRALGNRSILADPRPAENKEIINRLIKKRESYRPFAPSVLEEYVEHHYHLHERERKYPYMNIVLQTREESRALLGAVTHVDGSARVQTVSKEDNEIYWQLIRAFHKKTGVPIVLNTSFNNNVEPIVNTVRDAVVCFLTTNLEYLIVGDYLVTKDKWRNECLLELIPSLPSYVIMQQTVFFDSETTRQSRYEIQHNYVNIYKKQISKEVFEILSVLDGKETLRSLMEGLNTEKQRSSVLTSIIELWEHRLVTLNPV